MLTSPKVWLGIFCAATVYGFLRRPVPGRPRRAFFLALLIIALMVGRYLVARSGTASFQDSYDWFFLTIYSAPILLVLPLGVWFGVSIHWQNPDQGNKRDETP